MNSLKKTKKMTIGVKPLNKGLCFDIIPIEINSENYSSAQRKGWWTFSILASVIFLLFTTLGVYQNTYEFLAENIPVAYAGYDRLKIANNALLSKDFERAERWFLGAKDAFTQMSENARFLINQIDTNLGSSLYIDAAQKIIDSTLLVTELGEGLSIILSEVADLPDVFIRQNLSLSSKSGVDQIASLENKLTELKGKFQSIQKNLTTINPLVLPISLKDDLKNIQFYLGEFSDLVKNIENHFQAVLSLVGGESPHRYLILLQNSRERRATGGFIGSYALIDVNDGLITKQEVKDVYETDGQLLEVITPPPGIDEIAERYYMRDANYNPDFPESAKKIMQFLEKSKGPSVDTVIAIDEKVAEAILLATGPIDFDALPFSLTSRNFTDTLSFYTEAKLSSSNTPKQLLLDLIPVIKDQLFASADLNQLLPIFKQLAEAGHIQVYSKYPKIQALANRLKLSGEMIKPIKNTDFLSVISTSIGGNKSDAFVKVDLSHQTQIQKDGSLINELIISKKHQWSEKDFVIWDRLIRYFQPKEVAVKTLKYIHGQGENIDYMRVYVPKGSQLIGLNGIYYNDVSVIDEELYTIFAFKMKVKSGDTNEIQLSYRLPFNLPENSFYKFVAQRQAGAEGVYLKKSVSTPNGMMVSQMYPSGEQGAFDLHPNYKTLLNKNFIFAAGIKKRELLD